MRIKDRLTTVLQWESRNGIPGGVVRTNEAVSVFLSEDRSIHKVLMLRIMTFTVELKRYKITNLRSETRTGVSSPSLMCYHTCTPQSLTPPVKVYTGRVYHV